MEGDPLAPLMVLTKYSTLNEYSSYFSLYFSSVRIVPNIYISFVGALPWCELSSEDFETICIIYQLPQKKRSHHRLIRKNIHFITHDLMASQDNFNKKMPVRPDFKTIQKMIAEAQTLKASSSTYKKRMEDLVEASKRLQPLTEEKVPENPEADLRRKGKKSTAPPKRLTVARPPPALRQTTIPTGVAIREKRPTPTEPATAPTTIPLAAVPIDQVPGQQKRKKPHPSKEVDFLGTNHDELVREVLDALPPETAMVVVVHSKY
ncbi:uncharacterized protein LOC111412651 [Olea europaea var. sylvestris]|uniref:uncharacterized protein LOC111412651 n=1 Tax=Olea europaea var. sylvestris TaxID=158386 RepID=UPI000C1D54A4|nr:uncharacterized protein LOC111412651 [Olea europaea var. sylvestris]